MTNNKNYSSGNALKLTYSNVEFENISGGYTPRSAQM